MCFEIRKYFRQKMSFAKRCFHHDHNCTSDVWDYGEMCSFHRDQERKRRGKKCASKNCVVLAELGFSFCQLHYCKIRTAGVSNCQNEAIRSGFNCCNSHLCQKCKNMPGHLSGKCVFCYSGTTPEQIRAVFN